MKKLFSFLLFLITFQVFSQNTELYFVDPKTNNRVNNFVNIDVKYGTPTKVTLKLKYIGSMGQADSYNWWIKEQLSSSSVNTTTITNSSGAFTSFSSWSKDITFTINNNVNSNSQKQLTFNFTSNSTRAPYAESYTLYINVNNLYNSTGGGTGGGGTGNNCSVVASIVGKHENKNYDNNFSLNVYGSIIKNTNITAYRVMFVPILPTSRIEIYPNSKIRVKPCSSSKVNNELFVSNINTENDLDPQKTNIQTKITTENTFTISPNPTSNQVQINSTVGINEWFVYDINAKVVLSGNNKNTNTLKVNLQSLAAGLYYFKFTDTTGTLHEKTIIKK